MVVEATKAEMRRTFAKVRKMWEDELKVRAARIDCMEACRGDAH
jgi:hypothetical protein